MQKVTNECPFDFMTEFDDWWLWQVDVIVYSLTTEQAKLNAMFREAGWKLVNGMRSGGWTYPNAYTNVTKLVRKGDVY
jgi:hypothetical protein